MAAPTFAEAWVKFAKMCKVLNEVKKFAGVNATNFVDLARTYEEAVKAEGVEASEASATLAKYRGNIRGILASPQAALNPLLTLVARSSAVNSRATDPQKQLDDIFRYMGEGSDRITTRTFVRGSFASGSPYTGNGQIHRVTKDQYGFDLEASFADVYTGRVIKDLQTGADQKGRETWRFTGKPFIDEVEWGLSGRGSGLDREFRAVNGDDSLLRNASFADTPGGTDAAPTSIPGWTSGTTIIGDGTDYQIIRTSGKYYQESKKENARPASLKILLTRTLSQKLSLTNLKVDPRFPYHLEIAWKPDDNGQWTGDIQLAMGSKSRTVTVAAQTGWNRLVLPTTNQHDLYPRNWNSDDAAITLTITKTSGAATYLLVDRVIFCPMYPLSGNADAPDSWILPVSGDTAWLYRDTGTITDTETGAIIQDWLHRAYRRSAPSASGGSVTIAEP